MTKLNSERPITPAVFHILLALLTKDLHGYAIMKQVNADSQSRVSMGAGTLYGSLNRMMEAGLVSESDERVDPDMDDERRIYYKITSRGRKALSAEVDRLRGVIEISRKRRVTSRVAARHA